MFENTPVIKWIDTDPRLKYGGHAYMLHAIQLGSAQNIEVRMYDLNFATGYARKCP